MRKWSQEEEEEETKKPVLDPRSKISRIKKAAECRRYYRDSSLVLVIEDSFGNLDYDCMRLSSVLQFGEQRMDDGLIEVIGLTTNTLPKLLAGGKGICIGQCRSAVIRTRRTIPMQVDGEASRLNPATIELSLLNQVSM